MSIMAKTKNTTYVWNNMKAVALIVLCMFLLVGNVSAMNTLYDDVKVTGDLMFKGNSDDLFEFTVDPDSGMAEFEKRVGTLMQPASMIFGSGTVWLDKIVGLARVGHNLASEYSDGHLHLLSSQKFNGNLSEGDTQIPYAFNYTERMIVVPYDSGEWTGNIYDYDYPSTDNRMFKRVYYKTGATAATEPVTFRVWIGDNDSGTQTFKHTYQASEFPADSEIIITAPGHIEFNKDINYHIRISSDANFSLKTTPDLLYPWTAGDISLIRYENMLQTAPWENNTSYPVGQYMIRNRTILISNDSSVQIGSFKSNSDKWYEIASKTAMNYWTLTGDVLSHVGDVSVSGDISVFGTVNGFAMGAGSINAPGGQLILNDGVRNRLFLDALSGLLYAPGGVNYINVKDDEVELKGNVNITGNTTIYGVIESQGIYSTGIKWTSQTSAIGGWHDGVYGNNQFVAVGSSGALMTSPDGTSWTSQTGPSANQWMGVAYGNGLFVAVANTGGPDRIMTSSNGVNWTGRINPESNWWQSVTYGNGMFVAVSGNGDYRVMTSPDGINWTSRSAAENNDWKSITYADGLFVAVADSGTNRVMTSSDGITWTSRNASDASSWQDVTYGNGLFVAIASGGTNRVMTSPDGINWTNRSATEASSWYSMAYGDGLFVAVSYSGTNRVMTSSDGITWTSRTSADDSLQWQGVTYGNGRFVAVSWSGTNRVMTSGNPTQNVIPHDNVYQGGMEIYGNLLTGNTSITGTLSATGLTTLASLNITGETTLGDDMHLPTSWFLRDPANTPRLSIGEEYSELSSPDGNTEVTTDDIGAYITSRGYSAFDADATSTKLWGPGNNGYLTLTDTSLYLHDSTRTRISYDATNTKMISPDGSKTVAVSNSMIDAQTTHFNIGDYTRTRFDTKTDRTGLWGPDGTSSVILSNTGTVISGPTTVVSGLGSNSFIIAPYSQHYSGGSMVFKGADKNDEPLTYFEDFHIDNFWGYMRIFTGAATNKYMQFLNVGTGDMLLGINLASGNPNAILDVNGNVSRGSKSMQLRGGNDNAENVASQIVLSHDGDSWNANGYAHSISTRHNPLDELGNAIDFWVWDQATDSSSALGTRKVMTIDYAGVGIFNDWPEFELDVNGTVHVEDLEGSYTGGSAYVCVYDSGVIYASESACP